MNSSLINNLGLSSCRLTSTSNHFCSKTQSLISFFDMKFQPIQYNKKTIHIQTNQLVGPQQRNRSTDFFISARLKKNNDQSKRLSKKFYIQKSNEINSLFKHKQQCKKLLKKIPDKQNLTKITNSSIQTDFVQIDISQKPKSDNQLQLGLNINEFSDDSGQNNQEEDQLIEEFNQKEDKTQENLNFFQQEAPQNNQMRLGLFANDNSFDMSLEDDEDFQPSIARNNQQGGLSLGINDLNSETLSTQQLDDFSQFNTNLSDCGIKKNLYREVDSFEQEVLNQEQVLSETSNINNFTELSNKSEYVQQEPLSLKLLNFQTLFGDEIHEEDFVQYQFQDNFTIKLQHSNEKHLQLKGILKPQTEFAEYSEEEYEEEYEEDNEEMIQEVNEQVNYKNDQTKKQVDIQFGSYGSEGDLSIELKDKTQEKNKNIKNMLSNFDFNTVQTLNSVKSVQFNEEPKVKVYIKNTNPRDDMNIVFEKTENKKMDFDQVEDEDEDEDEDEKDYDYLFQEEDGSTTSRNSRSNAMPDINVETALFNLKINEAKQNNNVGISTFSLYYDRCMNS